ncbi:hypothetical protein BGX34_005128, partial [Mortierella sp. NVP85]
QFYLALEKARSVHELKVTFDWETTQSDFKMLRNTLPKTSVGVLELHLTQHDVRTRDILSRNQWYDPVLDIIRHRSIQSFTIRGPCDFTKRSSILSRNYDFSNLRHLDISLDQLKDDAPGLKCLISKSSNLSSLVFGPSAESTQVSLGDIVGDLVLPPTLQHLDIPLNQLKNDISGFKRLISNASNLSRLDLTADHLGSDNGYVLKAFNAIKENWAYSINFKGWDLCLPSPPTKESDQSMAVRQCLEHLLAFYCRTTRSQYLDRNVLKVFKNVMDSLGGSSDEDISHVEVKLQSSVLAQHFYFALKKARSVRELRVEIDWEATRSDFEKLRDTLVATNLGVLELYLMKQDGPTKDLLNRNKLYDPILDIMGHRSIQSFTIRGPRDFSKQSSLLSRNEDFPSLQYLDISLHELKSDIPGVTHLISKASNLSSLTVGTGALEGDHDYVLQTYNAIAEHRTYPINFKEWDLCLPSPPPKESDVSMARQCMEHLLKLYCGGTREPYISRNGQMLIWNTIGSLSMSSVDVIGRVEVELRSRTQAEHFYKALENARSLHEIKIELDWKVSQGDLEKLHDTLVTVNVGVLELHLTQQDGSTKNLSNNGQLYDAILDIMGQQSIQSFTIRGPQDFSKRSSLLSRNYDFSHLQHLDISLRQLKDDIPGVTHLINKASNPSSLTVGTGTLERYGDHSYVREVYNAIAEHRTYPIGFKDLNLIIPPPLKESNQSMATRQCMEQLLEFYCKHGSERLDADQLDKMAVDTLAKAITTTNGSAFKIIELSRKVLLGDSFVNNVSSIVSRSELISITIWMRQEEGRVRILESIQWKHLRTLYIHLKRGTFETSVMRALVNGMTKMSDKVELESFWFWSGTCFPPLILPEGDLLQTFVASASVKTLWLLVDMTLEQILSFLKSADFSRLERLFLWAKGFDSVKVDAILNGLQHSTKLRRLTLRYANITMEQEERMNAKMVRISNDFD